MLVWIEAWLQAWLAATLVAHMLHAVGGLLGGCLYLAVVTPRLVRPRISKELIDLGFIAPLVVGMLSGMAADHSVPLAMVAGMVAPVMLYAVLTKGLPTLVRRIIIRLGRELEDDSDANH